MRAWRLRLTIQAGDVEIDLEGAAIQIDEQLSHIKAEHTWTVLLERIREARESAMEAAVTAAREAGLPERGSAFRALLENCALTRKPDQVLGAIHYLRDVEGIEDSPPRIVNELFTDAGIDPPGNLSLYLNRLKIATSSWFQRIKTIKTDSQSLHPKAKHTSISAPTLEVNAW